MGESPPRAWGEKELPLRANLDEKGGGRVVGDRLSPVRGVQQTAGIFNIYIFAPPFGIENKNIAAMHDTGLSQEPPPRHSHSETNQLCNLSRNSTCMHLPVPGKPLIFLQPPISIGMFFGSCL
jgi:hypothetical protein